MIFDPVRLNRENGSSQVKKPVLFAKKMPKPTVDFDVIKTVFEPKTPAGQTSSYKLKGGNKRRYSKEDEEPFLSSRGSNFSFFGVSESERVRTIIQFSKSPPVTELVNKFDSCKLHSPESMKSISSDLESINSPTDDELKSLLSTRSTDDASSVLDRRSNIYRLANFDYFKDKLNSDKQLSQPTSTSSFNDFCDKNGPRSCGSDRKSLGSKVGRLKAMFDSPTPSKKDPPKRPINLFPLENRAYANVNVRDDSPTDEVSLDTIIPPTSLSNIPTSLKHSYENITDEATPKGLSTPNKPSLRNRKDRNQNFKGTRKLSRKRSTKRAIPTRPVPRPRTKIAKSQPLYANIPSPSAEPDLNDIVPTMDRQFSRPTSDDRKTEDEWVDFSDIEFTPPPPHPLITPYAISPTLSSMPFGNEALPYDMLHTFQPTYLGKRGVFKGHSEPNLFRNQISNHHYEKLNNSSSTVSIGKKNLTLDLVPINIGPEPLRSPPPLPLSAIPSKSQQAKDLNHSLMSITSVALSTSPTRYQLPYSPTEGPSANSSPTSENNPSSLPTEPAPLVLKEQRSQSLTFESKTPSVSFPAGNNNNLNETDAKEVGCFERSTLTASRKSLRKLLKRGSGKKTCKETATFYADLNPIEDKDDTSYIKFCDRLPFYEPLVDFYDIEEDESETEEDFKFNDAPANHDSSCSNSKIGALEEEGETKASRLGSYLNFSKAELDVQKFLNSNNLHRAKSLDTTLNHTGTFRETESQDLSTILPNSSNESLSKNTNNNFSRFGSQDNSRSYMDFQELRNRASTFKWDSEVSLLERITQAEGSKKILWCNLPEVQRSGILKVISAMESNLQEAIFNVYIAQVRCVKYLDLLEEGFVQHPLLRDHPSPDCVLTSKEHHFLFSEIPSLRDINTKLLAELEAKRGQHIILPDIGSILLDHALAYATLYVRCYANRPHQQRTLEKLMKEKPKFKEVLQRLESQVPFNKKSVSFLLQIGLRHLSQLASLLGTMVSWLPSNSSEYQVCLAAQEEFKKIILIGHEESQKREKTEEMLVLSHQLDFKECKAIPLISASRWLVKKGELTKIDVRSKLTLSRSLKTSKLYLFLFNDLLLIAKRKSEEVYHVLDYCPKNKIEVTAIDNEAQLPTKIPDVSSRYICKVTLHSQQEDKTIDMYLWCHHESERIRWMSLLTENDLSHIPADGDSLIRLQCVKSFTAQQYDELSVKPGDIVNVFRSTTDGWYEGKREKDGAQGWFPNDSMVKFSSDDEQANIR